MGIIITILLGALVGWLASIIMNRNDEQGGLGNIIIGIVGAFIGGFISSLFDPNSEGPSFLIRFDFADILWALAGAVVLTAIVNLITRKRLR